MSQQASHEGGAQGPHIKADEVAVDVTLQVPDVQVKPGEHASRETNRVVWKNVQLVFDQVASDGYGYAHDPKTDEVFMLPLSTIDRPIAALRAGQSFLARVTKAHFVTQIVSV